MLYIQVSPNRIFIINEYWIFVPIGLIIDVGIYIAIKERQKKFNVRELSQDKKKFQKFKKWKSNKIGKFYNKLNSDKLKKLKSFHSSNRKLDEELTIEKRQMKILKLFHLMNGNFLSAMNLRGGELIFAYVENYVIPYDLRQCLVEKGVRFVNNKAIRRIIYQLYKKKAVKGVIYITRTALCYLIQQYGTDLVLPGPVPVAIGRYIGISSWYQLVLKAIASIAITVAGFLSFGNSIFTLGLSSKLLIFTNIVFYIGVSLGVYTLDSDHAFVQTEKLPHSTRGSIQPRISNEKDVVSVDVAPEFRAPQGECFLADQRMANKNCKILHPISQSEVEGLNLPKYEKMVTMKDVTNLPKVEFSDRFDAGESIKPKFRVQGRAKFRTGKTVKFTDFYLDSESELNDLFDGNSKLIKE